MGAALVATGAAAPPAPYRPKVWIPPQTPRAAWPYTAGQPRVGDKPAGRSVAPNAPAAVVAWPAAGTSQISVSGTPGSAPKTSPRAGVAPVRLSVAHTGHGGKALSAADAVTAAPTAATVTVADAATARAAGVQGLIMKLSRADSAAGPGRVAVTLDYSGFASAFGGGYGARLRLVTLPACALTTPAVAACRVQTPVPGAVNNAAAGTLTADIDAAPRAAQNAAVFAAASSPSGSQGTYTATSLKSETSWSAGGSTGSFDYSVPITAPPSLGGSTPGVTLAYSSQSVDGETTVENQQPGWIGDGWGYEPGFIERSYQSCAREGKTANADYQYSGDNCWSASQVVSLSGSQHGGALVYDPAAGWKLSSDDGSKVELLTGAKNGAYNGEYWRVTDASGVQYYYGAGHLPGGTGTDALTGSAWTEPVYGPNSGDPCHASTFVASSCDNMAYRWNLDFVVDPHSNVIRYDYATETNEYASGLVYNPATGQPAQTPKSYVRAGHPTTISYGYRVANAAAGAAPAAQIAFTTCQRTEVPGCDQTAITSANASGWPDTPFDQNCTASPCSTSSPTFWSTLRLGSITTSVLVGSAQRTVDTWTLNQSLPEPGDAERPSLWLNSVQRTATDGQAAVSMPPVSFGVTQLPNQVTTTIGVTQVPALLHYRIGTVVAESGARTTVTYSDTVPGVTACTPTSLPSAQDTNTRLCFPENWDPGSGATVDWFNKYVVTKVQTTDSTGISPTMTTTYDYGSGGGAWHSGDSELADPTKRVWDQWRGFASVTTHTGTPGVLSGGVQDPITSSTTQYLRGMYGDIDHNGTVQTPAAPTDSQHVAHTDDNALAGSSFETQTFNGWTAAAGNGALVSDSISYPTVLATTATHTRPSPLPALRATQTASTKSLTISPLAAGGTRTHEVDYGYDTAATGSRLLTTDDKGDGTAAGEVCTKNSYAASASVPQELSYIDRVLVLNAPCGTAPTTANTVADARTLYDNTTDAQFGTIPGAANATATEVIDSYNGTTAVYLTTGTQTYDAYGRVSSSTDPNAYDAVTKTTGAKTTTVYSPSSGAEPTQITVTNPKNWPTVTSYDPGRRLPTHIVDPNGRVTDETYDALGRLTAVWKPGRTMGSVPADQVYTYVLPTSGSPGTPGYVETQTLREDQSYGQSFQILDSLLRTVQTQGSAPDGSTGAKVLTGTYYDSHGWTVKSSSAYAETSAPSGTFDTSYNADNTIPGQTLTGYDGAGRSTASAFDSYAQLQWTGATAYPGADETDVTPPAGGTPSTTITDVWGNKVQAWVYHTATATGHASDADVTQYAYTADGKAKTLTEPGGKNTWSWQYDLHGRVTQASDPDTGTTLTHYNSDGLVDYSVDQRGYTLGYTYDLLGRKVGEYQAAPHVALNTGDATTEAAAWTYDASAKGQPDSAIRYLAAPAGTGANGPAFTTTTTGYTPTYQPTGTSVTIPAQGLPANESGLAGTYQTTMSYTPNTGLLSTYEYPAAGNLGLEDVNYTYNVAGDLLGAGQMTYQTYTPLGQPWATTLGGVPNQVVLTNTVDPATGRLQSTTLDKETSTTHVDATSFTYDADGLTTSISDTHDGTSRDNQCFTYDWAGRLKEAWTSKNGTSPLTSPPSVPAMGGCATTAPSAADLGGPAPYWQSYTSYDSTGNRVAMTSHDVTGNTASDVTTGYQYAANRPGHNLSSTTTAVGTGAPTPANSYGYDTSGNTTTRTIAGGPNQSLTWDAEGHLASITDATTKAAISSYLYNPDGSTLLRRDAGETTLYLPGQELHLKTGTNTLSTLRYYSTPGGMTIVRSAPGTIAYEYSDPHGTATTSIDAASLAETHRYMDPYGNPRAAMPTWVDDHAFLNKPNDTTTGLTQLGARQYDASTGRFISVDPVFESGDPQQMGGYAYAGDSPVTGSDPTGTSKCDADAGICNKPAASSSDSQPSGFCDGCDRDYSPGFCDGCDRGNYCPDGCIDWTHIVGHSQGHVTVAGVTIPSDEDLAARSIRGTKNRTAFEVWATQYCAANGTDTFGDGSVEFCNIAADQGWSTEASMSKKHLDQIATVLHFLSWFPGVGTFAAMGGLAIDARRGDTSGMFGDGISLLPFGKAFGRYLSMGDKAASRAGTATSDYVGEFISSQTGDPDGRTQPSVAPPAPTTPPASATPKHFFFPRSPFGIYDVPLQVCNVAQDGRIFGCDVSSAP